jgi:hypothetical protein
MSSTNTRRARAALVALRGAASLIAVGFIGLAACPSERAVAQNSVTPSCPEGYVFSGGTCVTAAPTPSCPDGFVFTDGACALAPQGDVGPWVLLMSRDLGVTKASELAGATICVESGKPSEAAVTAYFEANNLPVEFLPLSSTTEVLENYSNTACDVAVVAESAAAKTVRGLSPADGHIILPEKIAGDGTAAASPTRAAAPTPAPAPAPAPAPTRRAAPEPQSAPIRRAAPRPAPVDLATPLQTELKRIGCLTGRVDGIWGRGSRAALKRFSDQAGLRLGSEPSQQAIDEARRTDVGYCRPVRVAPKPQPQQRGCRSGTVLLEGQCIPNSEIQSFCGPGYERSGSKCVSMAQEQEQLDRCVAADFAFCEPLAEEYCEGDGSDSCFNSELDTCLRNEIGCSP